MRSGILAVALLFGLTTPALAEPPACAGGSAVPRIGKPLPGGDDLFPAVLSSIKPAEASAAASVAWCLETTVPAGSRSASLWHDPSDPAAARLTVGTGGYEVRAVRDAGAAVLLKLAPGVTIYDLILVQGDKIQIVGFFDGPPPIDAMVAFFVNDRFGVYADIDVKTHKVTVYRPF